VVPAVTDTISYKLDGADELVEILTKLGNLASQALFDGAMAGGKVIADEANRLAPGPGITVEPEEVGRWSLFDLSAATPGYAAALAVEGAQAVWRWEAL